VLDLLNVFIAQQSRIGKHIGWGGALLTPELESNKGGIYIYLHRIPPESFPP